MRPLARELQRFYILTLATYQFFSPAMSSCSKSADCRVCGKAVSARQQALECDQCQRWVHRLCGTEMSQKAYRDVIRLLKDGGKFSWTCRHCNLSANSTSGFPVADDPNVAGDLQADVLHDGQPLMESTRLDTDTARAWYVSHFCNFTVN